MVIGAGLLVVIVYVGAYLMQAFTAVPQVTIDEDAAIRDIEKPHCPSCGSYNLSLRDNCDGLKWLKGKVAEIDYYVCNRCGQQFNDENWQDAKAYPVGYRDE